MKEIFPTNDTRCAQGTCTSEDLSQQGLDIIAAPGAQEEVCCGAPPSPPSNRFEKPGYRLLKFVDGFVETPAGTVPRVKTGWGRNDYAGTIAVRLGIHRGNYKIAPGLYCVGTPGPESPVLVTANYKLSFDTLRKELEAVNAWILVVDTRGINVWCAAGKELFSTTEVVNRVRAVGLDKIVQHKKLILPQLAATGVSAHRVKKESGFRVVWGPIRAGDVKAFIADNLKANESMRRVSFSTVERLVLVPVELSFLPKKTLWVALAVFIISGIGSSFFSLQAAWYRGLMVMTAYIGGVLAGAVVAPILLPWLPGRALAIKGALTGIVIGVAVILVFGSALTVFEALALMITTVTLSSYLAMNFTGSTPYTSPSGVEKEMRRAIPVQAAAILIAAVMWVGAAFAG